MNQVTRTSKPSGPGNASGTVQSLLSLSRRGVAWVVLAVCLLGTVIGWQTSLSQVHDRGRDKFDLHIRRVTRAIEERMKGYEQVLKGAAGLFAASKSVERGEWHDYVKRLDIQERYEGIRALGFIERVSAEQLEEFITTNRSDGPKDYDVSPPGKRPEFWAVKYVEPESINASALGYDISTESRRREAAEFARDEGKTAITQRIKLVQTAEEVPAVLLLLPIFHNGMDPRNVAQRRVALQGWVYGAFIVKELMDGLVESKDPEIDFEMFDDNTNKISLKTWIYDTDLNLHATNPEKCTFRENVPIQVVNRTWTVHFNTRPAFDAATDYNETRLLVIGGICISLLLFGITRSLASTRHRALGIARQMTEKFQIQERAVIASSNGIFITDASAPHNPVLYANPAMERITGHSAEDMIGRSPSSVLSDDTKQIELRELQNAMTAGRECRVVLRCLRQDQSVSWMEVTVAPVRDADGIVNHCVGVAEDITERRRAEDALQATNALQRAILDSAGYAVISTSPDGLIRIFNAAAERMTGYKAAEVIGRPTSMLIHDWTEVEKRARELSIELDRPISPDFEVFVAKARLGQADEHEWTYIRKDGSRLPVLLSVTPVRDERGVILGFMGIASDITERKRSEAQLHQATVAAEMANRAKGEFLANMSHEIRTPMNAVIGMTELAMGTDLTREQRGYLSAARNSATDLLTIINDVLDFSKIEAGKLELHPAPFHLRDALGFGLKAFSLRAAEKKLELSLRVDPDVPDALVGDIGRLRQILNNLVGNALKFTYRGEVLVEVTLAGDVDDPHGKVALHFCVTDTGIGIPQEKQKLIFEAFTQADASVTREYGGTGLGLAIADRLSRLMDGDIWVESEVGMGSRFHFTAGFGLGSTDATDSTVSLDQLKGNRVLVVDDNATSRGIICEMLSSWRMVPVPVSSVIEGSAALRASARDETVFHFVLIDSMMPGGEGFGLAQEIQRGGVSAPRVIVMLSSAGDPDEMSGCRRAGIDTYLTKPVGQSELLDAILQRVPVSAESSNNLQQSNGELHEPHGALRVLLAEDNPVNRELATTVLHKLGHSVVTVSNGREAVDAWEGGGFDLILMDVQMPAMDGLEATALIRQRERATGRHVPIVGLTAHAMKGDREHGLSSGMDEYVTKPLRLEDLVRAIRKWVPRMASGGQTARSFHHSKLLKSLGNDDAALRRLVSIFLESTPPLVAKLRGAAEAGDLARILHAAHTLKGSLAHLDERNAYASAAELERRARSGVLSGSIELVASVERDLGPFQQSLLDWLNGETEAGDSPTEGKSGPD